VRVVAHDRQPVRLADVVRVHALEDQPVDLRDDRDQPRPHQPVGDERAGEQPPDLRRGLALEDQPGT
jgi:hypothetical protein